MNGPFSFPLKTLKLVDLNELTFSYLWIEQNQEGLIRKWNSYMDADTNHDITFNEFCTYIWDMAQTEIEQNLN